MINDLEAISEHIHDADPQVNENMVHWLHQFINGHLEIDRLKVIFEQAYDQNKFIKAPWQL